MLAHSVLFVNVEVKREYLYIVLRRRLGGFEKNIDTKKLEKD